MIHVSADVESKQIRPRCIIKIKKLEPVARRWGGFDKGDDWYWGIFESADNTRQVDNPRGQICIVCVGNTFYNLTSQSIK